MIPWSVTQASFQLFSQTTRLMGASELQVNKGTAFGQAERERLSLRGLLPAKVLSMDSQVSGQRFT